MTPALAPSPVEVNGIVLLWNGRSRPRQRLSCGAWLVLTALAAACGGPRIAIDDVSVKRVTRSDQASAVTYVAARIHNTGRAPLESASFDLLAEDCWTSEGKEHCNTVGRFPHAGTFALKPALPVGSARYADCLAAFAPPAASDQLRWTASVTTVEPANVLR